MSSLRLVRSSCRSRASLSALALVVSASGLLGCRMRDDGAPAPAPAPAEIATAKPAVAKPPAPAAGRPRFVKAPGGSDDVPAVVRRELEAARAEKREVLVYVG